MANRDTVLRTENLCVSFPETEAVRGVSLDLGRGELLALVGESGSGKSVLCRTLLGLPPAAARVSHTLMERPPLQGMSLVMQNAMTALDPAMPVGKQIAEANPNCRFTPAQLLSRVGVVRAEERVRLYPGEFSGGMRQRAAIAIALAMEPSVIFADEPTTSLDADMRMNIMNLLDTIRKDGTAVLFVTHDLRLVKDFADRVLIMKDGEIVERGSAKQIFSSPCHDYTKELIRSSLIGDPSNHTHGKIHYHGSSLHAHEHIGKHRHDKATDSKDRHGNGCLAADTSESVGDAVGRKQSGAEPLISGKNLCKSYRVSRGRTTLALRDASIEIYQGETVGLCGKSGIGKSTLARILAGLERPSEGSLTSTKNLRIQMIFQDSASALNPHMDIERIIGEPLYLRDGKRPSRETVLELMRESELGDELASRGPRELSGGQRQRVAIARAISTRPDLIIADEPVSSLDVTTCSRIIHLLRRLNTEHGLTMLLISHDLALLAHVCDRIAELH